MNVIERGREEHATTSCLETEKLPERSTAVCRSVLLIQERMAKVEVAEVILRTRELRLVV
jgi:hypothetical protein